MKKLKVGDIVKIDWDKTCYSGSHYDSLGTIVGLRSNEKYEVGGFLPNDREYSLGFSTDEIQAIYDNKITTKLMSEKNIITRFINKNIKEPNKSLRKAEILDNNDIVTDEGMKMYVTQLILKDTAFLTDVVKPLVEEIEEENKK